MDDKQTDRHPRVRLAGQGFEGEKEKSHEPNDNEFIKSEPPPWQVSVYIKILLVQLGARGIIPRKACTRLINLLGLRGV
jgi:hypothetical protein